MSFLERLKAIKPNGWTMIVVAVALAAIDALNRYGGIGIEIPAWLMALITGAATGSKTVATPPTTAPAKWPPS